MTQPEEQIVAPGTLPDLPGVLAGNEVDVKFRQTTSTIWLGEANCKHGITRNETYLIAPGVPPLNHAQMVQATYLQHDQVIRCDCPKQAPKLNATVTFQPAMGVEPGQQRYVPQASAVIEQPRKNLWWGPGLTCSKPGAYALKGKVVLGRGVAEGARGFGVVVVQGVPVYQVPMVDVVGKATADIDVMLNLTVNQSVAVGYENTSTAVQDVTVTTLTVSEIWVP